MWTGITYFNTSVLQYLWTIAADKFGNCNYLLVCLELIPACRLQQPTARSFPWALVPCTCCDEYCVFLCLPRHTETSIGFAIFPSYKHMLHPHLLLCHRGDEDAFEARGSQTSNPRWDYKFTDYCDTTNVSRLLLDNDIVQKAKDTTLIIQVLWITVHHRKCQWIHNENLITKELNIRDIRISSISTVLNFISIFHL